MKLKAIVSGLVLLLASAAWAAPVDLNSADAKTLETLNGVGPAKAQAIVDYRSKNGSFKSVDDLEKVKGIGPALVAKNRDNLSINGKTTAAPPTVKTDKSKPAK